MEQKTKIHAEPGKQEIIVTRDFDLPVALVFKAYTEPEILAQWMGTKVAKLECQSFGSYRFETTDPMGNVHVFSGAFHEIIPDKKIVRTFQMENTGFEVQIEYLDFEPVTDATSKLTMHMVFRSVEFRDKLMQMPFAFGLNMAHNRLEDFFVKK
ncbi:MAG: SRPBCC domain-containing protein [Cytophagaceae bacterium]|nr:SRPBCC domain-containing protein [Cytophagaceae bacterium]MBL0302546.1 SRPBCC domain-containing protein [Cytophagaceae bacterium]MBL0325374.1 SRPBCC domain-containing protein [Cytophagaceae bacterium]